MIADITGAAPNDWFSLPRATRAFLVAQRIIEAYTVNLGTYDRQKWRESLPNKPR